MTLPTPRVDIDIKILESLPKIQTLIQDSIATTLNKRLGHIGRVLEPKIGNLVRRAIVTSDVYRSIQSSGPNDLMAQLGSVLAGLQQFTKVAQSTPPQTAGHAAQPPGDRA